MPSARRVPDAEVLLSSMTGRLSVTATRGSRTTLMSGSDVLADGADISLPAGS